MLSLILLAALQTTPVQTAAVNTGAVSTAAAQTASAPAVEEAAEPAVIKPKKVCRTVADTRVSALSARRKVCREVFED